MSRLPGLIHVLYTGPPAVPHGALQRALSGPRGGRGDSRKPLVSPLKRGAQGRNRTADTGIFNPEGSGEIAGGNRVCGGQWAISGPWGAGEGPGGVHRAVFEDGAPGRDEDRAVTRGAGGRTRVERGRARQDARGERGRRRRERSGNAGWARSSARGHVGADASGTRIDTRKEHNSDAIGTRRSTLLEGRSCSLLRTCRVASPTVSRLIALRTTRTGAREPSGALRAKCFRSVFPERGHREHRTSPLQH